MTFNSALLKKKVQKGLTIPNGTLFFGKTAKLMGLTVITCSRKEYDEWLIEHIKTTCGVEDVSIYFITNQDNEGLSKVYNHFLEEENNSNDITVFIHDDIKFYKDGWGKELLRLFEEHEDYGIIGVAGSAQFGGAGRWWDSEKRYGQVLHCNGEERWLSMFSEKIEDGLEEVCCIDGLFMAVHRKRITKKFDEDFTFDFYDISFCLANYADGKTKIGVTTNISVAHQSIGNLRDEWTASRDRLFEKYKGILPIDMPKKTQNPKTAKQ